MIVKDNEWLDYADLLYTPQQKYTDWKLDVFCRHPARSTTLQISANDQSIKIA